MGRGAPTDQTLNKDLRHIAVLRDEAIMALAPECGGRFVDGTFGAGGYTRAILAYPQTRVLAFDRDPIAIAGAGDWVRSTQDRLCLIESRFSQLDKIALDRNFAPLDGVVFDVGVSSMQFDEAARGFSFRGDGPLDMRMEGRGLSAADIVNTWDEDALADVFYFFGEERAARRIARAITHDRKQAPFLTTKSLAGLIERVAPNRSSDIHPATKSFQALRIAVNNELEELLAGLAGAEKVLAPGGRLAIVSYHSLEDRIVKLFFSERCGRGETGSRRLPGEEAPSRPSFQSLGRQPIVPSVSEIHANPRARSAKLRFAIRTDAPSLPISNRLEQITRLPMRDRGKN
ncbi:MAG: 16S rRNA (cytosine(1402)-N(4))-methyltransferase RsmH [Methylocystis sp.]